MRRLAATWLFTALAFLAGGEVLAQSQASDMKCGTKYVRVGDADTRVESLCGPPTDLEAYERPRPSLIYDPGLDRTREVEAGTDHVEIWTYSESSRRFIRTLTFENNKLILIRVGGYGG